MERLDDVLRRYYEILSYPDRTSRRYYSELTDVGFVKTFIPVDFRKRFWEILELEFEEERLWEGEALSEEFLFVGVEE